MSKIKIVKYHGSEAFRLSFDAYQFHKNEEFTGKEKFFIKNTIFRKCRCHFCKHSISALYTYLITRLKHAGLLPDDYKLVCCRCK